MFTEKASQKGFEKSTLDRWRSRIQISFVGLAGALLVLLLAGCDVSIPVTINTGVPNTKVETQTVPLTGLSQVYICDKTGNVTLSADSSASAVTMEIKRTIYTPKDSNTSASAISQRQQALKVSVQNINQSPCGWLPKKGDSSTLVVNATSPDDGNLLKSQKDQVHLNIVFPASMVSQNSPIAVRIEAGNDINLSGFAGKLTILSNAGNVKADHITLTANSTVHAQAGNIVFAGSLSGSGIQDEFQSDTGDISLTLPASSNVSVDAKAPTGDITNPFSPDSVQQGVAGASMKGPLNPGMGNTAPVLLKVTASTGNIVFKKA